MSLCGEWLRIYCAHQVAWVWVRCGLPPEHGGACEPEHDEEAAC